MDPVTDRSRIHPSAFIGPGVELGVDVAVGPYATLLGPARIGDGAWIGPGASIGAPPEIASARHNAAWAGDLDHAGVEIGAGAVVREQVVVHSGSVRATEIGAGAFLLARAYVAHDVRIGAGATVSAGVSIGGHCVIGSRATLGMNAVVHQHRVVGPGAMVGMGTTLSRDVPPWAKVYGTPPRLHGLNVVGLARAGRSDASAQFLERRYSDHDFLLEGEPPAEAADLAPDVAEWRAAVPRRLVTPGTARAEVTA
ncbi:Acyl-(acyl-carrier-protein)--UDP-N-acetylglucosa mineO-acyltransferase [Beutenbergia cavernae DSM 12333]|uniref:Acyl-(Acyl-carrier-protein)--UDP-N-acetylglucosa mineO-acyltransferase n=1 Tax=Beutenbergia cavernae (strain ATCC BAA-8 / DSM 12333 / CCUG 43141 / JCM 11478 / NBRC 16432 / NCIMB 13614 / HKI 0122) TaxID=471853 RepID=C5C141_BEUC1|nr:acyl-ACP--UDP-N- acetylglucosamine O-acyltransferase [Beutenbergia cavernae]ACQ79445.1 Acyl-(acyl-carrier-protein)--UDP-N-acetylglucosa mineO-acyltransferase [Beutenbergia cavernae DSM 12333]